MLHPNFDSQDPLLHASKRARFPANPHSKLRSFRDGKYVPTDSRFQLDQETEILANLVP